MIFMILSMNLKHFTDELNRIFLILVMESKRSTDEPKRMFMFLSMDLKHIVLPASAVRTPMPQIQEIRAVD